MFLLDEINNTAAYTDLNPDSVLDLLLDPDNSQLSAFDATPEFSTICQNRIFVKTAENQVRFSKIGQEGPLPESFEAI